MESYLNDGTASVFIDKQKYRKINVSHEKGGYIKRRYACRAES
jgi:hypothetical protein